MGIRASPEPELLPLCISIPHGNSWYSDSCIYVYPLRDTWFLGSSWIQKREILEPGSWEPHAVRFPMRDMPLSQNVVFE